MKKLSFALITLVLLTAGIFVGYRAGENKQCTEIKLYNDYKFTCDGRKIQGPVYKNEYVKQSWEFHSSL